MSAAAARSPSPAGSPSLYPSLAASNQTSFALPPSLGSPTTALHANPLFAPSTSRVAAALPPSVSLSHVQASGRASPATSNVASDTGVGEEDASDNVGGEHSNESGDPDDDDETAQNQNQDGVLVGIQP